MSYKILLTSLKGGTGVTSCAVQLCTALSESGERVLLFDGDDLCLSACNLLGLQGENVYSLGDAERGACRVKQVIMQVKHNPNFYVLPSNGLTDSRYADSALAEVEGLFDYCICDEIAMSCCEQAIVVCDPYPLSVRCADKQIALLKDNGVKEVGVLLNKVNGGLVFDGEIMTPQEIATILHSPLIAVIPEDLNLPIGKRKPETAKAFKIAADKISGKSQKTLSVIKPYIGVFGLVKRKMRSRI
jgi:septum formation inhibitor-activating ATPase MinD